MLLLVLIAAGLIYGLVRIGNPLKIHHPPPMPDPVTKANVERAMRQITVKHGMGEHHDQHDKAHLPAPAPIAEPTSALLVQIDTRGMTAARVAKLKIENAINDGATDLADARLLRRYVPRGTDVNSFALTCTHCGWCEIHNREKVLSHNSFVCARCEVPVPLVKLFGGPNNPSAIHSEKARQKILEENPAFFDQPWAQ